jgi:hypothetical protein
MGRSRVAGVLNLQSATATALRTHLKSSVARSRGHDVLRRVVQDQHNGDWDMVLDDRSVLAQIVRQVQSDAGTVVAFGSSGSGDGVVTSPWAPINSEMANTHHLPMLKALSSVMFAINSGASFRSVSGDNPYFIAMLRVNVGKYKGAAAMNRNNAMDVVSLIFDVALDYLREKYAKLSIGSISFDGWSNKRKMRYIGVTLAAFDPTKRCIEHDLIAMPPMRGKHATALLVAVIERWTKWSVATAPWRARRPTARHSRWPPRCSTRATRFTASGTCFNCGRTT